jgi:sortase A
MRPGAAKAIGAGTFASKVLLAGGLILAIGCSLLARQGYLEAKAALAAVLIDRAWEAHLRDGLDHRPWGWADIVPVARLRAPRLGLDRPILSGAAGSALAFGLGHLDGTAAPGRPGLCALTGHRDTWARFLRDLVRGDELIVDGRGSERRYRVASLEVVDHREVSVLEPGPADRLILVTCYPFGALRGGPLRYIVTAVARDRRDAGRPEAGHRAADRRGMCCP